MYEITVKITMPNGRSKGDMFIHERKWEVNNWVPEIKLYAYLEQLYKDAQDSHNIIAEESGENVRSMSVGDIVRFECNCEMFHMDVTFICDEGGWVRVDADFAVEYHKVPYRDIKEGVNYVFEKYMKDKWMSPTIPLRDIIIYLSGGLVQSVTDDKGNYLKSIVLDYDYDCSFEEELCEDDNGGKCQTYEP